MKDKVSLPTSCRSASFLTNPIPCSAVQVPSISVARRTIFLTADLAFSNSPRCVLSYVIFSWKLPSPTWPLTQALRPMAAASCLLETIISARRLNGTATSVYPEGGHIPSALFTKLSPLKNTLQTYTSPPRPYEERVVNRATPSAPITGVSALPHCVQTQSLRSCELQWSVSHLGWSHLA